MNDLKTVTAAEFRELLKVQKEFSGIHFVESLNLNDLPHEVVFEDCIFAGIDFMWESISQALAFRRCSINAGFGVYATHFLEGVEFIDCLFVGPTDFGCGGHNKAPHEFRLERCTFQDFVSFSDCWFEGPVFIIGNQFLKGTDLLGDKDTPVAVSFDVPPVIEGNSGELDVSSYRTRWD